ncbi:alpha/beta fold hydrolase [Pseudomonas sp. B21128]|uniref:alpha/beta fold hydrolase n=1 Tax=Pseudomonas sp. B21128 TaxID=3235110 RepID=UPI003784FBCA
MAVFLRLCFLAKTRQEDRTMTDWLLNQVFDFHGRQVRHAVRGDGPPLVQILWGEEDQWIPIERGRALHNMIPGSQFHPIPNAGHLVQEDAPEAIVAALLRFL